MDTLILRVLTGLLMTYLMVGLSFWTYCFYSDRYDQRKLGEALKTIVIYMVSIVIVSTCWPWPCCLAVRQKMIGRGVTG